jgi:hypothetical protein
LRGKQDGQKENPYIKLSEMALCVKDMIETGET